MRSVVVLAVALAALAGPAAAEFGKAPAPSGFQKPKPLTGATPYTPAYPSSPAPSGAKPSTYGAPPAAEPFKPYEPYRSQPGRSVFAPDGKKKH